jgi:cytochrome c-type biogenesis protein CcmH
MRVRPSLKRVALLRESRKSSAGSMNCLKGSQAGKEPAPRSTQEQLAAASEMPAEQRNAMVLGMVQRLAERLRSEGGDPEGWARLVRSYLELGKAQDAREAARDGRRAFAQEPEKLRRLNELLRDLGIEG